MTEVLDPMTLMLYELYNNISRQELRRLTAVTNAPQSVRSCLEDGLDLFSYLNEEDLLYKDYLLMLARSLERSDLVEIIERFYEDDWKYSAFAFTNEIFVQTGEVPVVPRSTFRTVELSDDYSCDIVLHHSTFDAAFAALLTQGLQERGVKMWEGEFEEGSKQARYVLVILSKQYFIQQFHDQLIPILKEEMNPAASLQRIIPVLSGITPESVGELCSDLSALSQFTTISGASEVARLVGITIRSRLKITVSSNYRPAVLLKCTSKGPSGKNQNFDVNLAERDSFTVSRSENSLIFRGDKGIKGLRESQQNGHCVISSSPEVAPGVTLSSMGHPLTIIAVTSPVILPTGPTTLLVGREWISIASKRNASQCQAKVKLTVSEDSEVLTVRVMCPKVREEVQFTGTVVLGAGEGSNLRITMPGVDIGKQHCKISRNPEGGGWVLHSLSPALFIFLQLTQPGQEVSVVPGTELLLGTSSTVRVCEEEADEGIGMSDTCSKISGQ